MQSKIAQKFFSQTDWIYGGTVTDQDTNQTKDTISQNINPTSPNTAVRFMICVITRTSLALTITDTEIPVYQQSFPSIC